MADSDDKISPVFRRLRWPLNLTRCGMVLERAARAFWPLWTVALTVAALLSFGVLDAIPLAVAQGAALLTGGLLIWGLWYGLRRFKWPPHRQALARLDASMPDFPLSALSDSQVIGAQDAASARVWAMHQDRMAAQAARARPVPPDLRLAARDPFALRYVALCAALMAILFGAPARIADVAFLGGDGAGDAVAQGPAWEGWVEPPAYTGQPTIYLAAHERPTLAVPEGSEVSLRLYGRPGDLSVQETVSGESDREASSQAEQRFEIQRSGRISLQGAGGRDWEITATPDNRPRIVATGEMTRESGGRLRQPFKATDDYGVESAHAEITLDVARVERRFGLSEPPEPRDSITVDLPMPAFGNRREVEGALVEDLSQHPWANLPVQVRLRVEDAQGQTGESDVHEAVLPGRRFFDPLAAAVIELRRDLLWHRDNAPRSLQVLRAITHQPEGDPLLDNERGYLMLRVAMRDLESALGPDDSLSAAKRDEIAETLWEVAELLEDGDLADARERLRRAQERLSEAMRRGADPSEIDELMQDYREALRDYTRQLAEQGGTDGNAPAQGEDGMQITQDDLDRMLDRIQELMEEGRMAEAEELMAQLSQMMENMRVAQGDGEGEGSGGDGGARQDLADTLRDQQDLADDTFRQQQDRFSGDFGGGEGDGPDAGDGSGADDLAERQRGLREDLRRQHGRDLPGEGTEEGDAARRSLERAERAMEGAEEALRDGDGGRALDRQADALEAMREGMRQLDDASGDDRAGSAEGDGQAGGRGEGRDPLGRRSGELGRLGMDDPLLDGGEASRRARELLGEIRRRSGERERPQVELDYLRRLLDRF